MPQKVVVGRYLVFADPFIECKSSEVEIICFGCLMGGM